MHGNSRPGIQRRSQQTRHRQGWAKPLAGQEAFQRAVAPQGGLGWPQDSAIAPHEELCEAALGSCPELISLDSNKIAPHFYLLLFFGREDGTY